VTCPGMQIGYGTPREAPCHRMHSPVPIFESAVSQGAHRRPEEVGAGNSACRALMGAHDARQNGCATRAP